MYAIRSYYDPSFYDEYLSDSDPVLERLKHYFVLDIDGEYMMLSDDLGYLHNILDSTIHTYIENERRKLQRNFE